MSIQKIALPLLAAVAISVTPAKAATITFNINGVEGVDVYTYAQTENGITMTLSNPVRRGWPEYWPPDHEFSFENGSLYFGDNFHVNAFDFVFDANVKIISYTIGWGPDNPDSTFTLSAGGSITSTGNLLTEGEHMISGGGFSIASGATGLWLGVFPENGSEYEFVQGYLTSITIEVESIPEPSTYMLLTSVGLLGAGAYARRRRQMRLAV